MAEQGKKRGKFMFFPEAHSYGPDETPPEPKPEPEPAPGKYPCPCCGYLTFHTPIETAVGDICPVCFWENDVFSSSEDEPSDENHGITLRQGRENFKQYGAVEFRLVQYTRPPLPEEIPSDL